MKLTINPQDRAVSEYLKEQGIAYQVVSLGTTKRNDVVQDHYLITFSQTDKNGAELRFTADYYMGVGLRQVGGPIEQFRKDCEEIGQNRPRVITYDEHVRDAPPTRAERADRSLRMKRVYIPYPTAASALYSLLGDARLGDQNFYDFCDDLGLNSDSRKDLALYEECAKSAREMRPIFSRHMEKLDKLLEDY